jgi:hypothetical protein
MSRSWLRLVGKVTNRPAQSHLPEKLKMNYFGPCPTPEPVANGSYLNKTACHPAPDVANDCGNAYIY